MGPSVSCVLWRTTRGLKRLLCWTFHCRGMTPGLSLPFPPFFFFPSSFNDLMGIFFFQVRRNKAKSFIIWNIDFESLSFYPCHFRVNRNPNCALKKPNRKHQVTPGSGWEYRSALLMGPSAHNVCSSWALPPYLGPTLYNYESCIFTNIVRIYH